MALIERFSAPTLKRARAFLSQLVDGVLFAEGAPEVRDETPHERPSAPPLRSELLEDPAFLGVAGTRADQGVLLSWRTTDEQLESARGIATGPRSLRLILVRAAGQEVAVDTVDLGEVAAEGARLVPAVPGLLRAVASVGLFDGARFVSMAHGSVA